MTMSYTTVLTCEGCKGTLRFENERPEWKTYDYRIEQADECEKSARFVSENIDKPPPDPFEFNPVSAFQLAYEAAGRPKFIMHPGHYPPKLEFYVPMSYEYVACPVCDSHVKKPYMKGPE